MAFTLAHDDSPYADENMWTAGRIMGKGTNTGIAVMWDSCRKLSENGTLLPLAMVWVLHEHGLCYLNGIQALLEEEAEKRGMANLRRKRSFVAGNRSHVEEISQVGAAQER